MPLPEVVTSFEARFETVRTKMDHNKSIIPITWSGGTTEFAAQPPVLYSDPEHAISSWAALVNRDVEGSVLEWFQKPELIEYQVTIADKLGRHRVVNNRWAVKSQYQVING